MNSTTTTEDKKERDLARCPAINPGVVKKNNKKDPREKALFILYLL